MFTTVDKKERGETEIKRERQRKTTQRAKLQGKKRERAKQEQKERIIGGKGWNIGPKKEKEGLTEIHCIHAVQTSVRQFAESIYLDQTI